MRLRQWIVLAFAMVIGLLSGCTDQDQAAQTRTAAEISASMEQTIRFNGLQPRGADRLRSWYGIEESDVASFVLYTAESNVKADELAIIKVKDAEDTKRVIDNIQERIKAQTAKFKDYRPEEYYLIEKHVLKTAGPFVLFVVSKDANQMEHAFDKALK